MSLTDRGSTSTFGAAPQLSVRRDGPTVRITVPDAEISPDTLRRISRVLDDVVRDQGNLSVCVELPAAHRVNLDLLDILTAVSTYLTARDGELQVRTSVTPGPLPPA